MRDLPDIVLILFKCRPTPNKCVAVDALAPFGFNWSPKATEKLRVFVNINPQWPVPLLCLVVGRSCLDCTGHHHRQVASICCVPIAHLATLQAAAVSARLAASRARLRVSCMKLFRGWRRSLRSASLVRRRRLPTLHQLVNSALRIGCLRCVSHAQRLAVAAKRGHVKRTQELTRAVTEKDGSVSVWCVRTPSMPRCRSRRTSSALSLACLRPTHQCRRQSVCAP